MITVTSLRHPHLACKLHGAMIRAAAHSRTDAKGYGIACAGAIHVTHFRPDMRDLSSGFYFEHVRGNIATNITDTVLKALRCE